MLTRCKKHIIDSVIVPEQKPSDTVADDDVNYKPVHWQLDDDKDQHTSHRDDSEPLCEQ